MKNKLFNLAVKVTTVGMVLSMFATSLPASAAVVSTMKDTMTTLHKSSAANHAVTFTANSTVTGSNSPTPQTVFTFTSFTGGGSLVNGDLAVKLNGGSAKTNAPSMGTCVTGDVTYAVATSTVTVYWCQSVNISSSDTVELDVGNVNQLSNPGTAGAYAITLTDGATPAGLTGSAQVYIVDNDQVSISASINQTLNFDVRVDKTTSCQTTESGTDYTVALGNVDSLSVKKSTEHICMKLSTNASGGAVVQVKGTNGGMVSVTPAKTITSAAASLTAGTEGFGMCIGSGTPTSGTINLATGFTSVPCSGATVAAVPASWTNLADTGTAPISGNAFTLLDAQVQLAVASTTPASTNYGETWSFRCTATF